MIKKYLFDYDRNAHQVEFHDDIKTKFLHMSSGFGAGKSHALAMKLFQLSGLNRHIPGGCVVQSIADYKKDLLPIMEQILDETRIPYRYHQTDKWFLFPWSRGKLYIASAEKKIRGPNWGYCGFNEVTLISQERYREGIGRVRVPCPYPQIVSSGTPEGTGHWFYEMWIENPMPNSRIIYGDTRNNLKNLGEDYVATLENSYDPIMLDAYLRGLFVNMTGSRFYYAYDPKVNDDETIEQIDGERVYVTLDYNVAPMVATLWNVVFKTAKNGAIILSQLTGKPIRQARAFDTIVIEDGADVHKMSKALYAYGLKPETTTIYPDPSGDNRNAAVEGAKSCNAGLEQGGWRDIRRKSAHPRFRTRQLAVCNLLSKGLIKLNPKTCKPLKKDLEAVVQDKATWEKVKDNPKLTHASDGMDYFVDIEFPLSGHKPDSRSIKYR